MDYRTIIESKYNREAWQQLLTDIFKSKVQFYTAPRPVETDKNVASEVYYIGKITLEDGNNIAIYEVQLNESIQIERNKVSIRNLLTSNWRNLGYAGAFMFCYKQEESVLRFSYVSESWKFSQEGKMEKKYTDTKRYTYYLGEGHRSRTAIDQFKILRDSNQTLDDLTSAFSVEALSKDFFNGYKEIYEEIVEYIIGRRYVKKGGKWEDTYVHEPCEEIYSQFLLFDEPQKCVRDYIKKMMGRLVFLQFLEKKGWMGVPRDKDWGEGDFDFMQHLFADSRYQDDFIVKVLKPLFKDINNLRDNSIVSDSKVGSNIKVPYLNGGLFEPDNEDNNTNVVLPKRYLEKLFNFFSEYNFTIDENDPNDSVIGVDPEMLGSIFENLLEDNKDKGAFYTPKEIVRYMCQESLIAYLQTDMDEAHIEPIRKFVLTHDKTLITDIADNIDKKLKEVKICDPAIGSGAFPMGLLKELYACRGAIEDFHDSAAIKRHIIQKNIYGVDIEKGAVDIARLRFWLALIVDESSPETLPNLDFKIMQGNSLLESYKGVDLTYLSKKNDKSLEGFTFFEDMLDVYRKELRDLISQYYSCENHVEKKLLLEKIRENVNSQFKEQRIKIDLSEVDLTGNSSFFLWHTWFSDVFNRPNDCNGFDIVIGNPPYIKEGKADKHAFDGFRETSPYYQGKMDIWYGFACQSLDLLNINGYLCFIAPNNWGTNAGAKKMRNKVLEDSRICQMIDFGTYMVFGENASIQTMIMLFEHNVSINNYTFDYRKLKKENATTKEALAILTCEHNEDYYLRLKPIINRELLKDSLLTFSDNDIEKVLLYIAKDANYLYKDEATNGIHSHYDFVNNKIAKKYPFTNVGEGIFGLSKEEKDSLHLSKNENYLIKPYYTTKQIGRYYINPNNHLWIIYTDSSFKNVDSMNKYPNIKSHLDIYHDVITSDNKPYGLHRAREERFFKGEKIVCQRKCVGHPVFSYSDFPTYVSATFYIIKTNRFDLKFLTGLFNSKLIEFWLRHKGKMQGNNFQVDKEPLMQIPIKTNVNYEKKIIILVNEILKEKEKDIKCDTSYFEKSINNYVYNIYDIKPNDINIIESD